MFLAFCNSQNFNPLEEDAIQSYIFHCFRNDDSFGRANSAYSALRHLSNVEGLNLPVSPSTLLALRAFRRIYKRSREVKWVTLEDLNALLQHWSELQLDYWVLIVLSFFTLVRPAEILFLCWRHIFFEQKYIWLPWAKNDPEGDGTYVRLLPQALEALTRLKDSLAKPPKSSDKCEKASVGPFTWYHMKHGGATYLALNGWSFARIKDHGRWKSDQAARVYIHAPVQQ